MSGISPGSAFMALSWSALGTIRDAGINFKARDVPAVLFFRPKFLLFRWWSLTPRPVIRHLSDGGGPYAHNQFPFQYSGLNSLCKQPLFMLFRTLCATKEPFVLMRKLQLGEEKGRVIALYMPSRVIRALSNLPDRDISSLTRKKSQLLTLPQRLLVLTFQNKSGNLNKHFKL